jgi:hypothetical protein
MKFYKGERTEQGCKVEVYEWESPDGCCIPPRYSHPLPLRLDLVNHSPTGFDWGYEGSGPAQLGLALLADYFGDDRKALELHQMFKQRVVANLPHNRWILADVDLDHMVTALELEEEGGEEEA